MFSPMRNQQSEEEEKSEQRSSQQADRDNDYENFVASAFVRRDPPEKGEEWVPDMGLENDPAQEERKKVLQNLFQYPYELKGKQQVHQDILTILRNYPALASEKYKCVVLKEQMPQIGEIHCTELLPINILILGGAGLEVISELYNLYPDALGIAQYKGNRSLHFACKLKAQVEVIEFLMEKYPAALMKAVADLEGYLRRPLCILLDKGVAGDNDAGNEENLKRLARRAATLCPDCCKSKSFYLRGPLEEAVAKNRDPTLIRFLLYHMDAEQVDDITIYGPDFQRIDVDTAKLLGECFANLNKLRKLVIGPIHWTRCGFIHFMQVLKNNSSIQELRLGVPEHLLETDFEAPEALQEMIQSNKSIQVIRFWFSDASDENEESETTSSNDAFVRAVRDGIAESTIRREEIGFLTCSINTRTLVSFLTTDNVSKTVSFTIQLNIQLDPSLSIADVATTSRVENFVADTVVFEPIEALKFLSKQIALMPNLRDLIFGAGLRRTKMEHGLTDALVQQLGRNTLETLDLRRDYYHFDADAVFDCLKENTSLRCLGMRFTDDHMVQLASLLKLYNATLQEVKATRHQFCVDEFPDSYGLVEYWTKVNKFGRSKVRNPDISLREYVTLIGGIQDASDIEFNEMESIALQRLSMRYDLMRESPGIWSNSVESIRYDLLPTKKMRRRKRKLIGEGAEKEEEEPIGKEICVRTDA